MNPLVDELSPFKACLAAIRKDQNSARAGAQTVEWDPRFNLAKVNPLVQWMTGDVWSQRQAHDVAYDSLHDRGFPRIGCHPCTGQVATGEDARAGRWRGNMKTECGLRGRALTPLKRVVTNSHV